MIVGALFLLDLLAFLPYANICLGRGYWREGALHGKALPLVLLAWAAGAVSLGIGFYPVVGAAVLWFIFRDLYITNRFKNLLRGTGAPGFMSHHTALFMFLLEAAALLDRSHVLGERVFLLYRIDFGMILLCAGMYKALSGYLQGEGMEYGFANPIWCYWFRVFRRFNPRLIFFRLQDAVAAIGEVVMGILFFFPKTSAIGAALCIAGFLGLITLFRIGRLPALMGAIPLLWLPSLGVHFAGLGNFSPTQVPPVLLMVFTVLIFGYIALLPVVKVMQYLNLFLSISLPRPIQAPLTRYAYYVPIIMWRVFTADLTNFFVRIYAVDRSSGAETPLVDENGVYSYREFFTRFLWSQRFLHFAEAVAITTIFTSLKYYHSDRSLFEERLRLYASTLGTDDLLKFQYVSVAKGENSFEYRAVSDFFVDPVSGEITEHKLDADFDCGAPARGSHIRETIGIGSYLPKRP
jgi:hypothetical protein